MITQYYITNFRQVYIGISRRFQEKGAQSKVFIKILAIRLTHFRSTPIHPLLLKGYNGDGVCLDCRYITGGSRQA